jgi:hypothetical protein
LCDFNDQSTTKYTNQLRDTWDGGRVLIPTVGGNPKNERLWITMTAAITALFAEEAVNLRR